MLIGPVEAALAQRTQQRHRLPLVQQARIEDRHLPLEHRSEVADARCLAIEADDVVAVVQTVGPPAGAHRGLCQAPGVIEEGHDGGAGGHDRLAEGSGVDRLPVRLAREPQPPHGREPRRVVHRQLEPAEDVRERIEQRAHGGRQLHVRGVGEGIAQEAHVAHDGIERHQREPIAGEGVVGIVPLWPLGVEPDAAVGHEVAELHQQRHQQLLCQGHQAHLAARLTDQPTIRSDLRGGGQQRFVARSLELDGVAWIGHERVEAADAVRHLRIRVNALPQTRGERSRLVSLPGLEQPQQVHDLVVAPVADVAPGIVRVLRLPVDAGTRDAVRVVAVRGRGVEEDADEAAQEARVADAESLPVLEDVAPVALVAVDQPVLVVDPDGVPVPRPAGIAVAAAEGDGQVAAHEAGQLRVALRVGLVQQPSERDPFGQPGEPGLVALADDPAVVAEIGDEVSLRDVVVGLEGPAAHDVEEHVGLVVRRGRLVGGDLGRVGCSETALHLRLVRHEGLLEGDAQLLVRGVELVHQLEDRPMVVPGIGHRVPIARSVWRELQLVGREVRAHDAAHLRLLGQLATAPEGIGQAGVEDDPRVGVAHTPGARDPQGLGGLGPVGDHGVEGVEGQARVGQPLVAHVADGQVADARVEVTPHARRDEVVPAVEVADASGGTADLVEDRVADHPEGLTGREAPTEAQAQVLVDLLEEDGGAVDALVQVSPDRAGAGQVAPRLPQRGRLATRDEEDAAYAAGVGIAQDLVHCLAREEPMVGIAAAGREGAVRTDEEPHVAVADDAHEERRHGIDVIDTRVALAVDGHEAAGWRELGRGDQCRRRALDGTVDGHAASG